jgi:dethiobiotin synthetase
MKPLFVTGIGTDVGKTLACIIMLNALEAEYWKPVQAGFKDGTDTETVQSLRYHSSIAVHQETYKLNLAASPHIASREEGIRINLSDILQSLPITNRRLLIEGAGGLLVPLNESEFVADLIARLQATVILVSRNYLGSINHSLLTAAYCRQQNIDVAGWIFMDEFGTYEQEIAEWSGYPVIARIPRLPVINREILWQQSQQIKPHLISILGNHS